MRYFMHLAYNGFRYYGWQIQADQISVQAVISDAMKKIMKEDIALTGTGRTDTGVHARSFYAHFDTRQTFDEKDIKNLIHRLNSFLPNDIVIFNIFAVAANTHARFDAIERTYRYYISVNKNPFAIDTSYRIFFHPDIDLMNQACEELKRHRDFSSFSKSHTDTKTNNCIIIHAFWKQEKNLLVFEITANRFLRNMVRAITGTMLDLGKHKISLKDFRQIIIAKDRCKAGISVPAHALFLEKISYPFNLS
ncbi:MAG: tRNA pseudouridine synthase A [Bacteroidetes bacterium ADurb.Bin234]|nr:MAG: tRNA pseudouridine synthase A [Bacteroidetes bacterium ADurb.Bin234]